MDYGKQMRHTDPSCDKVFDNAEEMTAFVDSTSEMASKNSRCKSCMCDIELRETNEKNTAKETIIPEIRVASVPVDGPGSHVMTRRITIAGGFLDIALFTANCEQLKFVLELGVYQIYYNEVRALLITSLVLQLFLGLTMFLLGCHVTQNSNVNYTDFLNHATMGLVALITIVNIFIGTFGPKGTLMARCLGTFGYPGPYSPIWMNFINTTKNYMADIAK